MRILVTGSSGHLGEALVRTLRNTNHDTVGVDLLPSTFTTEIGSITDREFIQRCMKGVDAVFHTATLHKPHIYTHSRQDFIDMNVTGTLNLLEEAVRARVGSFIFTSTTSVFGAALVPPPSMPAAWITEDVTPVPKNIYGVTKASAEDLCELFYRDYKLPCLVLRTSRFFPEEDDREDIRRSYQDKNVKANEYLYRRVDLEDVVSAHLLALKKSSSIGFGRYIISATTPFKREDCLDLRLIAPEVLKKRIPGYQLAYANLGWTMFPAIERVYINERARNDLGWNPIYDFYRLLQCLINGEDPRSPLSRVVGSKGYHPIRP